MIQKMKRSGKLGFTMAELLIVVAIIAVLVAVAVPIFTSNLENAKREVVIANLRSAYAQAAADVLSDPTIDLAAAAADKAMTIDETGVAVSQVNTDNLPFNIVGEIAKGTTSVTFTFTKSGNDVEVTCEG